MPVVMALDEGFCPVCLGLSWRVRLWLRHILHGVGVAFYEVRIGRPNSG